MTEELHQLLVISGQVQSEYYHMDREGEGLLDSLYPRAGTEEESAENHPSSSSAGAGGLLNDLEEDHDMMGGGGEEGS